MYGDIHQTHLNNRWHVIVSWALGIVVFSITVFVISKPILIMVSMAFALIISWHLKTLCYTKTAIKFAIPLAAIIILMNLIFVSSGYHVIYEQNISINLGLYIIYVHLIYTLEALFFGIIMALRIITVIIMFAGVTNAIRPEDIFVSNTRHVPAIIALGMRFMPIIQKDAIKCMEAQRARGLIGKKKIDIIKSSKYILYPLITQVMERADDLTSVLYIKGYHLRNKKNNQKIDVMVYIPIVFALLIVCYMALTGIGSFDIYPQLKYSKPTPLEILLTFVTMLFIAYVFFRNNRGSSL